MHAYDNVLINCNTCVLVARVDINRSSVQYISNIMSFLIQLIVLVAVCLVATNAMMVKTKVANPGNLCRKMKRIIKTSDAAQFEKDILTPEIDLYLREGCSGAIYSNLMDKVAKKALELKVTVKPGFGVKAIVVLPDLVQMAVAAGTFNVRLYRRCSYMSYNIRETSSYWHGGLPTLYVEFWLNHRVARIDRPVTKIILRFFTVDGIRNYAPSCSVRYSHYLCNV